MNDRIAQALTRLFERHRIVFWYDAGRELRADFDALELAGLEKLELTNNEFGIKHKILREHRAQKFLLYQEGPQPGNLENWLLDVQLAQGVFRTDQVGLWLAELELGIEFADLVQAHEDFFKAVKRKNNLKRLLKPDDTPGKIRLKMLSVCCGADPRLDTVMESLFTELSEGRDDKFILIGRCNLKSFLWELMERNYGYKSSTPGVQDFAIELFKSCYAMNTDGQVLLSSDALVFLKQ